MGIVFAILIFSFIIIIHELGHLLFAKKNGIQVFEFSLGMGPKLLSKKFGETEYCLKLLPLGGSCMMGEDSSEGDAPEIKGNFNDKSVWARVQVIAGGPLFNFLLAGICASIMVAWIGFDTTIISSVEEGYPAEIAGIEAGDKILKLDNRRIYLWKEITAFNQFNQGKEMTVTYERDGEEFTTSITPVFNEEYGIYQIGISSSDYVKPNILQVAQYGVYNVRYTILSVIDSLAMMIQGEAKAEQISGPVGIVNIIGDTYTASAEIGISVILLNFLNLVVLLSANLGVVNLLPLPALDGGRLVFLAIEAIRGKRLPEEKEAMVHFVGFALLMVLSVFVLFNDVRNLF